MSDDGRLSNDQEKAFRYTHTDGFAESLATFDASLWVSTYQAGKLAVFRSLGNRLSLLPRNSTKRWDWR